MSLALPCAWFIAGMLQISAKAVEWVYNACVLYKLTCYKNVLERKYLGKGETLGGEEDNRG